MDDCPTIPGLAKYRGCPVTDQDNDGIDDENDKCPTVAGVARYQGCPIPDTDGDGVNDESDKCITVPGPASNNGCPEKPQVSVEETKAVEQIAHSIQFETGSAQLKTSSFAALQQVIQLLQKGPDLSLEIQGHTDNTGTDAINKSLSQARANAVKVYLLQNGVDANRIEAAGFGSSMPKASNTTAAGRARNRRVELKLK